LLRGVSYDANALDPVDGDTIPRLVMPVVSSLLCPSISLGGSRVVNRGCWDSRGLPSSFL
jgi:hypothetical protein